MCDKIYEVDKREIIGRKREAVPKVKGEHYRDEGCPTRAKRRLLLDEGEERKEERTRC